MAEVEPPWPPVEKSGEPVEKLLNALWREAQDLCRELGTHRTRVKCVNCMEIQRSYKRVLWMVGTPQGPVQ